MLKYVDSIPIPKDSADHIDKHAIARKVTHAVVAGLLALMVVGCTVGPNYKRPVASTPQDFRGALAPEIPSSAQPESSLGDQQWSAVFRDPVLQRLVKEALQNNLDLRIAAQRVLEAQAQLGITRSQQLPSVNAGGSYSALQIPSSLVGNKSDGTPGASFFNGGGFSASAAWNLDFWGMYRRQTEAARAELLSGQWAQRTTRVTLVQEIAQAYFQLRSLDSQLEITKNTIKARRDSLQLTQFLEKYGAGSLADTRQAEELLHTAQANLPELRRQIATQENAISILLGHDPEDIDRGFNVADQPHPQEVPTGIPSQLLERRSTSGSHAHCGKRPYWSSKSAILPTNLTDESWRIREQSVASHLLWPKRLLVRCRLTVGAHLRWRPDPQ
jgi:multidrug efflux system outer membrane protein